ncbi:MDR family MFS transporter [Nonomuraea sp. NPDC000554]|uniref:MDR family MFS transporter n=1 Tax=Nonomuraea sp. NPDC000554 TaxID=3154259 RepID=UPI0033250ABA
MTLSDGYGRRQVLVILAGLMLVTFVASLDQTVVAAAMYRIGESLKGLAAQAWVTTAFLITSTISVPVYGKLSDTHGRKPLFLVAIGVFLAGSVLCAFAASMPVLAVFRAVQGIGAGGILTLTSAVLGDIVPPRERARYGGYFVATYAVASVAGPVAGGALAGQRTLLGVDGWRWIFLINLPVGIAACAVVTRVLRSGHQRRRQRRVDLAGTLTLMIAAAPLLLVAQRGQAWGWSAPASVACYTIGTLGIAGFLLAERRAGDSALLVLRLFRNRAFAVGAGQALVSSIGMFASIVLLPLYLQLVKGYSPTEAGLLTLPQAAGTLAGSVIAGQFTSRTGRYKILPVTGSFLLLAGMLLLWRLSAETPLPYVESAMFLFGAGSGLYAQTITLSMQNALTQADLGVATSSNTFFRQVGGAAGAAVFLSIAYSTADSTIRSAYATARSAPAFRAAVAQHPEQAGLLRLASAGGQSALNDTAFLQHLHPVLALPFRQGFTSALDIAFLTAAAVMAAALVLALLIRELPLRTTIDAPPATPAEPARQ